MIANWSITYPAALPNNSVMTNCILVIDDARAWRYFITGCTGAWFCMPHRTPILLTTLTFCQRYNTSNTIPPMYKVNSFGITLNATRLTGKVAEQRKGKHVRVLCIEEFLVDYICEALMAASPRTDEVGIRASKEAAMSPYTGEVSSEPTPEVAATADVGEEEEEEDENRD